MNNKETIWNEERVRKEIKKLDDITGLDGAERSVFGLEDLRVNWVISGQRVK